MSASAASQLATLCLFLCCCSSGTGSSATNDCRDAMQSERRAWDAYMQSSGIDADSAALISEGVGDGRTSPEEYQSLLELGTTLDTSGGEALGDTADELRAAAEASKSASIACGNWERTAAR